MANYSTQLLRQVRQHLLAGGVIAYPTESCYGFGCDPFNYQAINRLIKLKGRSKAKGMIVIAGKLSQLNRLLAPLSTTDCQQLAEYWPGPYSLILPVSKQVPTNLRGAHRALAVRVTRNQAVRQLCQFLQMPLVSTSANHSGWHSIRNYRECCRQFGAQVLVLPGRTNFAKRPSTIIDWATKQTLR